eukprot:CAMPEP_0204561698 /NCGR_PEP_ID=MMETSP0661-20131031/33331_1 /ASSEMBLY_ACC=CAM_ASM_000606 /TAXON_ID=109239 /ORGANISM="Alexandrium margalefi, Strain AMGDE01CS-322" /LENGTH=407 /DNA_ID=CAMNT_0051569129 /DNA_START=75 /DNA_END=1299 /DNA_ORIENTATION=-
MEDGCRYDSLTCVAASKISDAEFQELQASCRPFLLSNAVGQEYTLWWCGQVAQRLADEQVYFVEGKGASCSRAVMQGRFKIFAEEVGRLSSRDSFAYMQSELLPEKAPSLVQHLAQNLPPPLPAGDQNLFSLWPRGLSPATMLLTIGGTGARTQLGREGLAAPQWHLCLQGHARFKLLPDDEERMKPLQATRDLFGIFNEDGTPLFDISTNQVTDVDLFSTELADSPATHLDAYGVDFEKWPDARLLPRALEVLIKPGEILVIPGGWWLQCYCDEPSWLVGADYLDAASLDRVLHGVLAHSHIDPGRIFALDTMPPEQRIDVVLSASLGARGRGEGHKVLNTLWQVEAKKAAASGVQGKMTEDTLKSKHAAKFAADLLRLCVAGARTSDSVALSASADPGQSTGVCA